MKKLIPLLCLLLASCTQETKQFDALLMKIDPCVEYTDKYENYFKNTYLNTTYGGEPAPDILLPREYPFTDGTWSENGKENKSWIWSNVSLSSINRIWICVYFYFDFDQKQDRVWESNSVKMFFEFWAPEVAELLSKRDNAKITFSF